MPRHDLVQRAQKQSQILEEALTVVLQGQEAPLWLRDHAYYRALEQVAWVNGSSEPGVIEDLVKQRAVQIQDSILRRQKARLAKRGARPPERSAKAERSAPAPRPPAKNIRDNIASSQSGCANAS